MTDSDPPSSKRYKKYLPRHLSRVANCGLYSVMVHQDTPVGSVYVVHTLNCSSRFCPSCAKKRRDQWFKKLKYFREDTKVIMMTLTFKDSAPDPAEDPQYYTAVWEQFLKRLRRKHPKLKFVRFVELTKRGRPHFHVLINTYIPRQYVKWAFNDCGGGYCNDIRMIDQGRGVNYVCKYLTKSFSGNYSDALFFYTSGMRSVSSSRDLFWLAPRLRNTELYPIEPTGICEERLYNHPWRNQANIIRLVFHNSSSPPQLWLVPDTIAKPTLQKIIAQEIGWSWLWELRFDQRDAPTDGTPIILA